MAGLSGERLGRWSGALQAFARGLGARVAAAASAPFHDRRPAGRGFLDIHQYLICLADTLDGMQSELRSSEDRLSRALARGRALRDERRWWRSELSEKLSRLSASLSGACGSGAVRAWLPEGEPLAGNPAVLHRQAEALFAALSDPELEPPAARPGVEIDLPVLAGGFEAPMARLGEALEALEESDAEVRHARTARREAAERLADFVPRVERFYLAFCAVAGEDRLAERLRKRLGR